MKFLKWLGGLVLLIWLLGFLFRIGGSFIHVLLVVAVLVFVFDWLFSGSTNIKK